MSNKKITHDLDLSKDFTEAVNLQIDQSFDSILLSIASKSKYKKAIDKIPMNLKTSSAERCFERE